MSRFKFVCGCGKRLAAYDWMVGRIVSCPRCGRTLTVPTPFKAEDQLHEMMERGYNPTRRKIGIPVDQKARKKHVVVILGVVVLVAAAAVFCYFYFLR